MADFDISQLQGLLGNTDEDRKKAMTIGLIGAGLGILSQNAQNPRGAGFSGAIGGAMPGMMMYQQALQNAPKERMQQLQGAMTIRKLQKDIGAQDLLQKHFGGAGAIGTPGTASAQMPNFDALIAGGVPAETVKALMEAWKLKNPELSFQGGIPVNPRTAQPLPGAMTFPQTNQQGFSTTPRFNPATGQIEVGVTPGSEQAFGTQQRIQQGTQAAFDLVDVPDGRGGTQKMTRAQAAQMFGGQPLPPVAQPYAPPQIPQAAPLPPQLPHSALAGRPPAEQNAIRTGLDASARGQPFSMTVPGQIPTSRVVGGPGYTPSQAQLAADKTRATGEAQLEIDRQKPTPGQNAVDTEFAKEYATYKALGGYADTVKQLSQLREVSELLGKDMSLTGPFVGRIPDSIRSATNPPAVQARNAVEEVVQRNLRMVLGAQFTEKEGERLIARAYNPLMSTEDNKKRVDRLITQIEAAAQAKQEAAEYFEKNGTLKGWSGKLYTIADFDPDATPKRRASDKGLSPAEQAELNELRSRLRR